MGICRVFVFFTGNKGASTHLSHMGGASLCSKLFSGTQKGGIFLYLIKRQNYKKFCLKIKLAFICYSRIEHHFVLFSEKRIF